MGNVNGASHVNEASFTARAEVYRMQNYADSAYAAIC